MKKKILQYIIQEEINKFQLKKLLNTKQAYEILDNSKAGASTWCTGGCAILSFALHKLFSYPIYVIYNNNKKIVEHFVNRTSNGTFIDCNGEFNDILNSFKKREYIKDDLQLLPYHVALKKTYKTDGITIDMNASNELVELIKNHMSKELKLNI